MKPSQKCRKCGKTAVSFFPVEITTIKKNGGEIIGFLCAISFIILVVSIIIATVVFFKNISDIMAIETNSIKLENIPNIIGLYTLWKISFQTFKISGIAFLFFLLLYQIVPYKRSIRVFAVCQDCGYKVEIIDEDYAYYNQTNTLVKKKDD